MIVLGRLILARPWAGASDPDERQGETVGQRRHHAPRQRRRPAAKPSASILARALLIGAGGVAALALALGFFFLRRFLKPARPAGYWASIGQRFDEAAESNPARGKSELRDDTDARWDMMPSSVSEACTLLGWSDRIVDVTVLGTRLTVAAAIDQADTPIVWRTGSTP
jgi:hypothetical protein